MAIEIVDLPIEVIFPLVMLVLPEGIQHLFIIGYLPYPNQTLPYPTLPTVPTCQPGSLSSCLSISVYHLVDARSARPQKDKQSWTVNISETQNKTVQRQRQHQSLGKWQLIATNRVPLLDSPITFPKRRDHLKQVAKSFKGPIVPSPPTSPSAFNCVWQIKPSAAKPSSTCHEKLCMLLYLELS